MPELIVQKDGVFNIFSTVTDSPIFSSGITEEELTEWYREEYGNSGMLALPKRIERARRDCGCSCRIGTTLDECISDWARVHKKSRKEFAKFLSLE